MKSLKTGRVFTEERSVRGKGFDRLKSTESNEDEPIFTPRYNGEEPGLADISPSFMASSPLTKSPWSAHMNPMETDADPFSPNVLMGSLVREEGHIYSLAASGDLLYTGSDSKNIRVWKNQREFSGNRIWNIRNCLLRLITLIIIYY